MSPATVVTFLPINAAASFNSFSRRPVITTCAPSSTKRLAVAKPIPLFPPVITAIFPANFWALLLLICFSLFFRCDFMLNLRLSSKADIIVEIDEFEEGLDIFPGCGKPAQLFGKERKGFGVAVRRAFVHEGRPSLDLPWRARGL